jgi:hypothetical protein
MDAIVDIPDRHLCTASAPVETSIPDAVSDDGRRQAVTRLEQDTLHRCAKGTTFVIGWR